MGRRGSWVPGFSGEGAPKYARNPFLALVPFGVRWASRCRGRVWTAEAPAAGRGRPRWAGHYLVHGLPQVWAPRPTEHLGWTERDRQPQYTVQDTVDVGTGEARCAGWVPSHQPPTCDPSVSWKQQGGGGGASQPPSQGQAPGRASVLGGAGGRKAESHALGSGQGGQKPGERPLPMARPPAPPSRQSAWNPAAPEGRCARGDQGAVERQNHQTWARPERAGVLSGDVSVTWGD